MLIRVAASAVAAVLGASSPASAHGAAEASGAIIGWDGKLSAGALLVVAGLYGLGSVRSPKIPPRRLACFALAWLVLALALVWPLDGLADGSLAAHMLQHMILLLIVPPLLVAAAPLAAFLRALPRPFRTDGARLAAAPLRGWHGGTLLGVATVLQSAVMTVWHVPWFYDLALTDPLAHVLEHGTLLASAIWFWWLLSRARSGRALARAMAMVFVTLLHMGMLGGLLTFARQPLYAAYASLPGTDPAALLADQQLAGLIMWVPAGFAYIGAGLWLLVRLLGPADDPIDIAGAQAREPPHDGADRAPGLTIVGSGP